MSQFLNKPAQKYPQVLNLNDSRFYFKRPTNQCYSISIKPDFNNVGGKRASDESKGKKFRKCRKAPRYLA